MKKLITLLLALALFGCSSTTLKLTNDAKNGVSLTAGVEFDPSTLVEVKEGTEVNYELAGNKYVITTGEEIEEVPVTYELMEIDGTLPVDLSKFYSDSSKLAKVSYVFNEDETVMTVTDENGEPFSFDVPIHVYYPSYIIADNIEIDTYVGYNINDFVTADEGVEITSTLDEENSVLNITLTKNDWSVNESKEVILSSSSPYPMKFVSRYAWNGTELPFDGKYKFTFNSPTDVEAWSAYIGNFDVTVDGDVMTDEYEACKFKIEGDKMYYCIGGLGRGVERDVPGSYYYLERVYE